MKSTESMFATVEFKGSLYVPEADYDDEFIVVMKGKITKRSGKTKDDVIIEKWGVDAERVQQLHIDPNTMIDAANQQLMAEVASFLSAEDYEADDHRVPPPVPIEGQETLETDPALQPPPGIDPETGKPFADE